MEPTNKQDNYDEKLLKDFQGFIIKNASLIKDTPLDKWEEKIFDKLFYRTVRTDRLIGVISNIFNIGQEAVELIVRSLLRFSYRTYAKDMESMKKQNARLRSQLRQAQEKNSLQVNKPEEEIKKNMKTPIRVEEEQRKNSKNKKRGKKAIKEMIFEEPADQGTTPQNSGSHCTQSRDILFYDIPARYNDKEVVDAIKQLGKINKIQIKKHHKYQSVKASINLLNDYEKDFKDGTKWKVQLLIGLDERNKKVIESRWFPGQYTVKAIKEKCKWKAYKIIKENYLQDVAKNNYIFEYGKLVRFGKQTVYLAYFKDFDQMAAAITKDQGKENAWTIHGKGRYISSTPEFSKEKTHSDPIGPNLTNKDEPISIPNKERPVETTPSTIKTPEPEEVVETVERYRKGILDEPIPEISSRPIKEYTPPEKVVDVITEWRTIGEGLVEKMKNKMSDYEKDRRIADDKWNAKLKEITSKPATKEDIKFFDQVNANCSKRLGSENPQNKSKKENLEEDCIKEGKKRILTSQGDRSIDKEESSSSDSEKETEDIFGVEEENELKRPDETTGVSNTKKKKKKKKNKKKN